MNVSWTVIWEEIEKCWCYMTTMMMLHDCQMCILRTLSNIDYSAFFAVEYFAKTPTIDVWQDYKYFAVHLHRRFRVNTLISKKQLNFNHKGNMEVRQIFFKKFCQRCAKAKKNNERDDWGGIIFQMPERAWAGNT